MIQEASMHSSCVGIAEDAGVVYPTTPPYRPSSNFPELDGKVPLGGEENGVYHLLRALFSELRLDSACHGTPRWNPLGAVVRPGDRVVVKPNLVRHLHTAGGPYQAVVTHASLVRAVLDYVALALGGEGEIVVGDAPVQSADFGKILERTGLKAVCDDVALAWGIPVSLVDFRLWTRECKPSHGLGQGRELDGDAAGYRAVDLGQRSLLTPLGNDYQRFRVTSYDCLEMARHHNRETNEYLVPQTVLNADVVINLPKLKTHRKVGLTAALKNLVGINGHKDWLPHHRMGSVEEGGDEYPHKSKLKRIRSELECKVAAAPSWTSHLDRLGVRLASRLSRLTRENSYEEGSWYGNDTLWRTVLDLNRLLYYADREGVMTESLQRRCFTVVDGIVAGEGEGPMQPDARPLGLLVAGGNQVAVDAVLATMVGFDYRKIPTIRNGFHVELWPLAPFHPEQIQVSSSSPRWRDLRVGTPCRLLRFVPPSGWRGQIEFDDA